MGRALIQKSFAAALILATAFCSVSAAAVTPTLAPITLPPAAPTYSMPSDGVPEIQLEPITVRPQSAGATVPSSAEETMPAAPEATMAPSPETTMPQAPEATTAPASETTMAPAPASETAEYAGEAVIEQIDVCMPAVTVYGYGIKDAEQQAHLGDKTLQLTNVVPFRDTDEGTDYYVLMDVSNSIPNSYFREIRTAVESFANGLSEKDSGKLITFGESVEIRADLKEDVSRLPEILSEIHNTDNRTMLFEAISQAAELARSTDNSGKGRKIILAISDGEDVAEGKRVAQEALKQLNEKAVPVYALCIRNTDRNNINSFGEFARSSGGNIEIFKAGECGDAFAKIKDHLDQAEVLTFKADSNRVSHNFELFSLGIPQNTVPLTREVLSYRYTPDTEVPVLLSAEHTEGRKIVVRFSKAVKGAENPANYQLKGQSGMVPVGTATPVSGRGIQYQLTASEAFTEGHYSLSCSGITDDTQDENPVSNTIQLELGNSEPAPPEPPVIPEPPKPDSTPLAAAVLALLTAIGAIIAVIATRRKKEEKKEATAVDPVTVAYVHHEKKIDPHRLGFRITDLNGRVFTEDRMIDQSMIIGRSSICDLSFREDERMSKQHFALEWDGKNLYLTDLDSTNGTMVNGKPVLVRVKLERGDLITAGNENIQINW